MNFSTGKYKTGSFGLAVNAVVSAACLAVSVAGFFLPVEQSGYYDGCPVINRVSYMFCHTGIFTCVINLYAFWCASRFVELLNRDIPACMVYVPAFVAGFVSTFGTEYGIPTCGLSGVVYFLLGMASLSGKTWLFFLFFSTLGLSALLSRLADANINDMVHLAGFTYGVAYYITYKLIQSWLTERRKRRLPRFRHSKM